MTITVELTPELEDQLRDLAEARGLSAEGYLLTLIEALVQQKQKPSSRLSLPFPLKKQIVKAENPDRLIADTLRQMRASVLEYKEQAVEAVARMNMLRSAIEQQEHQAAEKELQAICALQAQNTDQAKRLFQEKTVLDRHLETIREELAAATEAAAAITQVFQQEEARAQARASRAQASALNVYRHAVLTPEQITQRLESVCTNMEWDRAFEQWVLQKTQPSSPQKTDKLLDPVDFSTDLEAVKQTVKEWAKETKRKRDSGEQVDEQQ